MDGLRKPVGDQEPQVYWVRRAVALLALAVVILIIWLVIRGLTSGGGEEDPAPTGTTSPDTTTSAAPASTAQNDPSRACTGDDLTVSAVASPENVNVGSMPAFEVRVEHTGALACSVSTNAEGTSLVVRSGDDVYYDSAWCPDLPVFTDADWVLQPGDREALQANWTGQRYDQSCTPGDVAPAGTFRAAVAVAGVAAEEATFQMVE